ncbi:translation initiation factor IF-2-like [Motacilla alba alba]|uniref:translation initiation factor IF-2-like n=1 Tax=Motacilla alba alba TaxID=1094192 RepID=UPI0018D581C1|nr:translation initiation factor IF-2-like [Motacilla alba alba]
MLRRLSPGRARLPAAAPAAAPSSSSFSSSSSERVGSRAEPLRAVPPPPPCLGRARRRRGEQLCGAPGPGNGDSGAGRAPGPAPLRSPPRGPGGRSLGSSRRRLLRAARPRSSPGPLRSPARGAHHGRGFREGRRAAPPRPRDASANTQSSPSHPATGEAEKRRAGYTGGTDRAARAVRTPLPAGPSRPTEAAGEGGASGERRAEGYGRLNIFGTDLHPLTPVPTLASRSTLWPQMSLSAPSISTLPLSSSCKPQTDEVPSVQGQPARSTGAANGKPTRTLGRKPVTPLSTNPQHLHELEPNPILATSLKKLRFSTSFRSIF